MDVFVINSSKDVNIVDKYLSEIRKNEYSFNSLLLRNSNCFWRIEAKKKIKKAQMVLFVEGEQSHTSPYIGWEIETAKKYNKPIYTIKIRNDVIDHPALFYKDSFTGQEKKYDIETTVESLINTINNYASGTYNLFNRKEGEYKPELLFEQYKLFLQTSEDLVSRRQSVNNFYITINSVIIAFFSAILAFNLEFKLKLFIGFLFALVGIIVSASWIRLLTSYGNLNSSKMKIISSIEKQLPASLYDAEWAALSDKLNKKKYISFTQSEKAIPFIFIAINSLFLLGVVIAFIISII